MQSMNAAVVVVLGTGGTIAGAAASAQDNVGYTAGQLSVQQLVAAVPALGMLSLECEQVANIDSKDMSHAVWQRLAQRCAFHLARSEVAGIVVTHGTDTLEETAYFLHRVLAPTKPVVLTAAMRPATSLQADGPQNLLDAVSVARAAGARGVVAVLGGRVFGGSELRKVHTYRLDAFDAGDAGPLAVIEEGCLRMFRAWPEGTAFGIDTIARESSLWPRVELLIGHAGVTGALVDLLVASGVQGIAVAGVGNGHLASEFETALRRAQAAGVSVLCASRCAFGAVLVAAGVDEATALPSAGTLSPAQARIELLLRGLVGAHAPA